MRKKVILPCLLLVAFGCTKQKTESFTLGSGKTVELIEFTRKQIDNPPDDFITFKYISKIDFEKNEKLLNPEFDEIWNTILPTVEEKKIRKVVIEVQSKPKGNWFASTQTKFTYVSRKNDDGTWH